MQKRYKFWFCLFIMICGSCLSVFSQTAKERYNKGVKYMNQKNYSEAIRWFKSSQNVDKSPENHNKCQNQIDKCNEKIATKDNKSDVKREQSIDVEIDSKSEVKLEISKKNVGFPAYRSMQKLQVHGDPWPNWDYTLVGNSSWVNVKKGVYGDSLYIQCENNIDSKPRTAQIIVTTPNGLRETINITQLAGARIDFYVDGEVNYPKIKQKGEQIVVKLHSTSQMKYAENNNRNWRIVSMPSWCHQSNHKKDKDGYGVALPNELVVIIDANKEMQERQGVIRLESQGVFSEIRITQKK